MSSLGVCGEGRGRGGAGGRGREEAAHGPRLAVFGPCACARQSGCSGHLARLHVDAAS